MASISLKIYSAALKTRTNVNVIIPTLLPAQDGMNKRETNLQDSMKHMDVIRCCICFMELMVMRGTGRDFPESKIMPVTTM